MRLSIGNSRSLYWAINLVRVRPPDRREKWGSTSIFTRDSVHFVARTNHDGYLGLPKHMPLEGKHAISVCIRTGHGQSNS